MGPILIVHGGPDDGAAIPISKAKLAMGSLSDSDVRIDGPGVLPRHAEIFWGGAGYYLTSLDKGNKTSLNHRDIGEIKYLLKNGDRVRLGDSRVSHELSRLEVPAGSESSATESKRYLNLDKDRQGGIKDQT